MNTNGGFPPIKLSETETEIKSEIKSTTNKKKTTEFKKVRFFASNISNNLDISKILTIRSHVQMLQTDKVNIGIVRTL